MNINLQKILFGFLICTLIVFLLLSNSSFQKKIISNYFLDNSISEDIYLSINDFDYNIFHQNLNTDISFIKQKDGIEDTVLFLPKINLEISLFRLLLYNDLHINKVIIDNPKLNFKKYSENEKKYIESLFFTLSNFNKKISFSTLKFTNIHFIDFDTNQVVLEKLNCEINDLIIESNFLNMSNISLHLDDSYLHGICTISNDNLSFHIKDSKIYSSSNFLNIFSFEKRHYPDIQFSAQLLANLDSIYCATDMTYGKSKLNFDIINQENNTSFQLNHSNLKFQDFDSIVTLSNYLTVDSLRLIGQLNVIQSDSLKNIAVGSFDTDYGKIDCQFHIDSTQQSNFLFEFFDFNLASLTKNKLYGLMDSKLEFNYEGSRCIDLEADVSSFMFNNYNYKNIFITLERANNMPDIDAFVLDLSINDKNLKSNAEILCKPNDISKSHTYSFIAKGNIDKINLNALDYLVNDSLDFVSANFITNEVDLSFFDINITSDKNLVNPVIKFQDIYYSKNYKIYSTDFLNLEIGFNAINLESSIGSINAKIPNTYNTYITHYLMDILKSDSVFDLSDFSLQANLTKASFFSDVLLNKITFDDIFDLALDYQDNSLLNFYLSTRSMHFSDVELKNINIKTKKGAIMQYDVLVDELLISNKILLDSLCVSMLMRPDYQGDYRLTYSSTNNQLKKSVIQGGFNLLDDSFSFGVSNNSFIHFSNQDWALSTNSELSIKKNDVHVKNLSLYLDNQIVALDGHFNSPMNLSFSFQDFHVNHLNPLISNNSIFFDGILNGSILFNEALFPMLIGNLQVNDFSCNNVSLGELKLTNSSNKSNDSIYVNGIIEAENQLMSFLAIYPLDKTKEMTAKIEMNEFPVAVLDPFLNPISNLKGKGTGKLKLFGPIDSYKVLGETQIHNVEFNIPYLNTHYTNHTEPLILDFKNDSMFVQDFIFSDSVYETKARLSGSIHHKSFKDMSYKLTIESDSLFALNTSHYDNEHYYGSAFLKGNMIIDGNPSNITLTINSETQSGSRLMIPLSKSKDVRENQFIQFLGSRNSQLSTELFNKKSNFNMNFNLDINNNSEIQLIFDEEIGDVIKGYGEGELLLKITKTGDFEVFGDFFIEEGNYLFTLQDVITKSFDIENGGMIRFNGNPYNALIDLNLLYNVQASLNPLNPDYDRKVKSPVICRMEMSEELLSPDMNFFIDITNSDQIAETSLETITNTEQKLLEQFLYLLIANSFLVENDPSIDYLGNTLATTGTELLSNQLSNWLSQTTDAFDLGFKWVPGTGDSLSYQQVELAVSKKFLDDRVIVNGNVGTPPDQSEANIVGDVDIEYDFFKDGRLRFRVFNRAKDYDPLSSESLGYEQGFGIFFKKQFNSIRDLFIRKKQENKQPE